MSTFFSYKPKSGSRVIAMNPVNRVVIAKDDTMGTWCLGDVVNLSYFAAKPGMYWREYASRAASELVASYGGLAEDCQGTINLVIPRLYVMEAFRFMEEIEKAATSSNLSTRRNELELWKAKLLVLDGTKLLEKRATQEEMLPVYCSPSRWYNKKQQECFGFLVFDSEDGEKMHELLGRVTGRDGQPPMIQVSPDVTMRYPQMFSQPADAGWRSLNEKDGRLTEMGELLSV